MARAIKNVLLVGGTGNVGSHILAALLRTGLTVTVLTRGSRLFPSGVVVKKVDYENSKSLFEAMQGQDAVVDASFSVENDVSLKLIEAAATSGVYRFITSDFGLDPDLPGVHDLPVFERKKKSYEAVKKKARDTGLTYSLIVCGPFLDLNLSAGFAGIELKGRTATLFNDGKNVIPWTTLEDIGTATAGTLLHPEETSNRPVYIHSVFMSQLQLLDAAKDALGPDGWEISAQAMTPLFQKSMKEVQSGRITPMTFGVQIQYAIATRELARPWDRDDNTLVGLQEWTTEQVRRLIKRLASQ
ncbi:putative isoflavone reductase family protein CipA [Thelonectria olida]|uniref:Isoflavone reductase family protein CipA n=1 Tax=Thelonectria olida TaxID=1576542 RepID=A0A9P8VQM0_9HYPO|nr:putative isoflavone reductase family protein CipA [Thelonectria olida]